MATSIRHSSDPIANTTFNCVMSLSTIKTDWLWRASRHQNRGSGTVRILRTVVDIGKLKKKHSLTVQADFVVVVGGDGKSSYHHAFPCVSRFHSPSPLNP